ncbi:ORMDL family-domain-containing protein [Xylaria acuta]|nr:ORMDL family-domain-containing protein [Xylaria acuta]
MTAASDHRAAPVTSPVNTAKLSSPILIPRTVSYDVGTNAPRRGAAYQNSNMGDQKTGRRRRSSSILQIYQEPLEPIEQLSDQSALPNLNANWVNAKGAWTIHIVLIIALKILWDVIPGVSQETSWTLTNISYMFGSYIMFHWVRGVPFDFNSGAYDNLNMWEQIDDGAQYTPAKKFLLSVPIVLFLLSTHYTHYDLAYFTINFLAVLGVVIPKLPFVRPLEIKYPAWSDHLTSLQSHRMRVGLFSGVPED